MHLGIFSGTMSFLFNTWDPETQPFSDVVVAARAAGFTEPDPRDDLNGLDVARKVNPNPRAPTYQTRNSNLTNGIKHSIMDYKPF